MSATGVDVGVLVEALERIRDWHMSDGVCSQCFARPGPDEHHDVSLTCGMAEQALRAAYRASLASPAAGTGEGVRSDGAAGEAGDATKGDE